MEHFSNGAILKSNISQIEHFSNGAILKSNISQMEQFSNGAFWGRHPMPYFKIPRTEKYGMRCARGDILQRTGRQSQHSRMPIHCIVDQNGAGGGEGP